MSLRRLFLDSNYFKCAIEFILKLKKQFWLFLFHRQIQTEAIAEFKKQLEFLESRLCEKEKELEILSKKIEDKDDLIHEMKQKQKTVKKEVIY